jgi:zinc/manganese transport system permease protein
MTQLAELRWMLPPLVMCLVLTGIHGYLGIHVVSRKVIFVDLALAQIAALGSTYALLLGYDPRAPGDSTVVYLFSLVFTIIGAAVFSLARMRHEKVPQEAFIGIVYAAASAIALLLLSKSPGESEHIREMLVGNVLLVTWPTILKTAAIYATIGVFHFLFRKRFFEISTDPEGALARGRRVRLWDFAFYASFGLVITSSVAVAGVLLVFSFLVVPAVVAFMFQETMSARIVFAWGFGTLVSGLGMVVSYYGDLPTGPSVVACFAALLAVAAVIYYLRGTRERVRAVAKVALGAVAAAALLALTLQARKGPAAHAHAPEFEVLTRALASEDENVQIEALHHLANSKDPHAVELLVTAMRQPRSERVLEHILLVLPEFGPAAAAAIPAVKDLASQSEDPFLRYEAAQALFRLRSPEGFEVLLALLEDDPPVLVEQKAGSLLEEMTGVQFGLGVESSQERARVLQRFKEWFDQNGRRVRWRPDRGRFE